MFGEQLQHLKSKFLEVARFRVDVADESTPMPLGFIDGYNSLGEPIFSSVSPLDSLDDTCKVVTKTFPSSVITTLLISEESPPAVLLHSVDGPPEFWQEAEQGDYGWSRWVPKMGNFPGASPSMGRSQTAEISRQLPRSRVMVYRSPAELSQPKNITAFENPDRYVSPSLDGRHGINRDIDLLLTSMMDLTRF